MKIKNLLISIIFCLAAGVAGADTANQLKPGFGINPDDGQSFSLRLDNRSDSDMFCPILNFSVIYDTSLGYQFSFEEEVHVENTYMRGGMKLKFDQEFGLDESEYVRSEYPKSVIVRVKFQRDFSECREATFVDYCEHAEKSDKEEYTMESLRNKTKVSSCQAVDRKIGKKFELTDRNIESVKPLSMITRLTRINLNGNKISDIRDFKQLVNLRSIRLENNPIKSLEGIYDIMSIKELYLKRTLVESVKGMENFVNLYYLDVSKTNVPKNTKAPKRWMSFLK